MKATSCEKYYSEWRVYFDTLFMDTETHPRLRKWCEENVTGVDEVDWRVSGMGWHAAFLKHEDALLCYIAFR